MKRFSLVYIIAAMTFTGCAVEKVEDSNADSIFAFESWIKVNYPEADATPRGVYIIEDSPKTDVPDEAPTVDDAEYIRVHYVIKSLKGKISSSSDENTAKQEGKYEETSYYGPRIWQTGEKEQIGASMANAGVKDMIKGMKEGDSRTAAIPGWLMTTKSYSSKEEYQKNVTGNSHAIYTVTVEEIIPKSENEGHNDLQEWQNGIIGKYIKDHTETGKAYPNQFFDEPWTFREEMLDTNSVDDKRGPSGSEYGFYYDNGNPLPKKEDSVAFAKKDTTLLINYTGRRIITRYDKDGNQEYDTQVFDTTDEKVAKRAGIHNPSKTYGPVKITWGEKAADIKMGDSSSSGGLITGFSKMLWNMQYKHKEWVKDETDEKGNDNGEVSEERKAVAIFYSDLGYGYSGSGSLIPAFSPLMFEIEIIKEEKKEEEK